MASVRKRTWRTPNGEVRFAWVVDFCDASGRRDRKQFGSKREADTFRVKIESDLSTGTYRSGAGKVTVREVAYRFIEHGETRMQRRERMTRSTLTQYKGHIHNYICPDGRVCPKENRSTKVTAFQKGIGNTKLGELTRGKVEQFCDDLRNAGVTIITSRKILGTLKVILRYAVSRDLVALNVADDVRVIGRRDEGPKRIIPPTKEAMKQLLAVADNDFRVKLIVAAATGMRAGEFHALRWRHVDLVRGEIKIETRVDAYGVEDVTKTAAGMREVPLGSDVVTVLKEWKLRTRYKEPDQLVFPSRRGRYTHHANMVKRKFLPLFDKLKALHATDPDKNPIPPARFDWHALRHFAISCWIEAGLSPKTVQTFAGHSNLQVTMDRYGHMFKSDDHRLAMDAIAKQMLKT